MPLPNFGASLSESSQAVLDALTNEEGKPAWRVVKVNGFEELHTDLTTASGLNSYRLGEQHKLSSWGENVGLTNGTSGVNWYPTWGGIKDQAQVANQNMSGVHSPSGRMYNLWSAETINGIPDLSGSDVDMEYTIPSVPVNTSVYSIQFILGEDLVDEVIIYTKTDNFLGKSIYDQKMVATGNSGDTIQWHFEHPVEFHANASVSGTIRKKDGTLLKVKASVDQPLEAGWIFEARPFEDVPLSLGGVVVVNNTSNNINILHNRVFCVDTTTEVKNLFVDLHSDLTEFTVFDGANNFGQNSCFINIGIDSYELNKKKKSYRFYLVDGIWNWTETDLEAN